MLLSLGRGFVAGYFDGEDPILHLVVSVETVSESRLSFAFTDGHAELAVSEFFEDLAELTSKVDWQVMRSKYWNDTPDHPDRKRKRQAEFLIHEFAPWTLVEGIGVKSAAVKLQVERLLSGSSHMPNVAVRRDWYYG